MSNKITAEKLIEDRRGIDALLKGFETVDLTGGDVWFACNITILLI